jgi:DNA-binding CsgD family transcriptional regulator
MPPETPHDLPNGDRVLVIDTETAAHNLASMLQRFRSGQSEPLFFGDEGRPEGVVISFDQWQQLVEDSEQAEHVRTVTRERLANAAPGDYVPVEDLAQEFGWNLDADGDQPYGDSLFAAMRAGARGYLVKGAEQEEIARAIRAVAAGEAIFGPGVARRVLGFFAAPPVVAEPFPELTSREREILDLLASGLPNATIGQRLGLASKTVANNVSAIFTKLQVADRAPAIVRARDAGLGRD